MRKNKKISVLLIVLFVLGIILAASTIPNKEATENKSEKENQLKVIVTIPPQRELVEEIGKNNVNITTLVPPGKSPHSYELTTAQMEEIAKADLYFIVGTGVEFEERYLEKIINQNPRMKIVNGSKGIELRNMKNSSIDKNENQERKDPHIWLSPKNAKKMVETLLTEMKKIKPSQAEFFETNAREYIVKLENLDERIMKGLSGYEGRKFLIYHPAFGYFADRYGLTQITIEEEGKKPRSKGLQTIIAQAKRENISVVFVSPQFDKKNTETIAEAINGEAIFLDPLAENYINNLEKVYHKLHDSLQ